MVLLDFFRWVADIFHAAWLAARNRPQVTCDVQYAGDVKWCPDFLHDKNGEIVAQGVSLELALELLLANNGPVDTTLKDAYIAIKRGKKEVGRLTHFRSKFYMGKIVDIQIGPRKVWGPQFVYFGGFVPGRAVPSQDLKAELIVVPVAQRPVRKKLRLSIFEPIQE